MFQLVSQLQQPIDRLARFAALVGGIVLVALAVMTLVSIIGREDSDLFGVPLIGAFLQWLDLSPVPGDFELVEAGAAFAICMFMPYAQLSRGHAEVGILTDFMSKRANAVLDLFTDLLLLGLAGLIAWRHAYGLLDKLAYNETTFILRFPVWWAYALMMIGLVIWIIVGLWCVVNSSRVAFGATEPTGQGVAR